MTYRALLVGNSVFEADASLHPLNAPAQDVARLHRALVDPATGMFDEEHVRMVVERTSDELLDELDVFFAEAHRDDLLLLYYSGHGLLDERNQLFLCGRNTRSHRLLRTAVGNVRINEFIEQSVARCTVIILDCCSSGMFKGGPAAVPLAGPGRYVVSSTRGPALANDATTPTGTSLFTEHLVNGLLGAAEDRDGDGYLDLREIYDYVRVRLTETSKQVPHCRFDGDAAVVLARLPGAKAAHDTPAPVPEAQPAADPEPGAAAKPEKKSGTTGVVAVGLVLLALFLASNDPDDPKGPPAQAAASPTPGPVASSGRPSASVSSSPGVTTPPPPVASSKGETSRPPAKVTVPELGTTQESAEAALSDAGLEYTFADGSSSEIKRRVFSSRPAEGARVTKGSVVTVLLSLQDLTRVPDVVGFLRKNAVPPWTAPA